MMRLLRGVVLVGLFVGLAVRSNRPPDPVPASAPVNVFSAERAMRHVRAMAARPHPSGSADHVRVREYVIAELAALGLTAEVQEATGVGTRMQVAGRVHNVMARLPGTTPAGPAVLLMAHYDGVAASPAASDDASGCSVLLEVLRALRSGPPLAHDVIALFTDAEEPGLIGAAAFVREHRWAKDVAVTFNFDSPGTTGRVYMFETGPGNLDLVRVLRGAPDAAGSSLWVTVYRTMPNDSDLSELALLGRPALNFAFVGGFERYHTSQDDVAHLNPGSIQQAGTEALVVTRTVAAGPLPRPVTGDAVFFDFPGLGLVFYPEWVAWPLAVIATGLVLFTLPGVRRRERRWVLDLILGALATLLAVALGGGAAFLAALGMTRLHAQLGGNPDWSSLYAAGIAMLALTLTAACWALARRWGSAPGTHAGTLLVWAGLTLLVTWKAPGASFLFAWPLLAASVAALLRTREGAAAGASLWIATIVAAALLGPVIYLIGAVVLGLTAGGGVVMGVLVPLVGWLLAPQFEAIAGERRWLATLGALAATGLLFAVAAATVRQSVAHPAPSTLVYALDADGIDAWLATPAGLARPGSWGAAALGPSMRLTGLARKPDSSGPPEWLALGLGWAKWGWTEQLAVRSVPRMAVTGPVATVIEDSLSDVGRRLVVRIVSAPGTLEVAVQSVSGPVLAAAVDGRAIDTTRYRFPAPQWALWYTAPPDSGFTLALTLPRGAKPVFDVTAQSAGIPPLAGVVIPPRPDDVVPVQTGDVTVIYRRVAF